MKEARMLRLLTCLTVFGACGVLFAPAALGQVTRPFEAAASQGRYSTAQTAPTVSPYLNLGVTPGGLSNYQSLVRPLIEERASLDRQWAELDRLNQQVRGGRASEPSRLRSGAKLGSRVRFMHYSHYFNAGR